MLKKALQTLRDDSCIVSLMLTERCNFRCAHCFYNAGPHKLADYMNAAVLKNVEYMIYELESLWTNPSVNLVGGEPTLDMEEFERVLGEVASWNVPIQMTTNGWFLHRGKTREPFFVAVVNANLWNEDPETFLVRISDDVWHDEFRPAKFRDGNIAYLLRDILDGTDTEGLEYDAPVVNYLDPWIYVEPRGNSKSVIPIGRGAKIPARYHDDVGAKLKGRCGGTSLTFRPNGELSDICCRGSNFPVGTVKDHPLVLIALAMKFVEDCQPTCATCHALSKAWIAENMGLKEKLELELDDFLEELASV